MTLPHSTKRISMVLSSLAGGGTERAASTLAGHWSEDGHHVSVVTLDDGGRDAYKVPAAVERVTLDETRVSPGVFFAIASNLRRIRRLRAELRRLNPDVVVSFQSTTNVLVLLAGLGRRTPILVSERVDPRAHPISRAWSVLRLVTYRRAAALVIQTESVLPWARRLVEPGRVRVIPNMLGIKPPAETGSSGHVSRRVVAMGRLVPQKGFDLLVDAFALCSCVDEGWELRIYGEGPERDALLARAAALGVAEHVALPGFSDDPGEELADAALFVLPSRYEGFPNILLEAMACGVAAIAFDCRSGPSEIITHGVDGMLVRAEDVEALAAAMEELMRDDDERRRLGNAARGVAERFGAHRVMRLWEAVINDRGGAKSAVRCSVMPDVPSVSGIGGSPAGAETPFDLSRRRPL